MQASQLSAEPVATAPRRLTRRHVTQEVIVLGMTVVLFIVLSIALRGFASTGNLLSLVRSVSVLGVLAVGMAVVVIGRGLDLSQVAIVAVLPAWVLQRLGQGVPTSTAVLSAVGIALAVGLANGLLVAFVELPALFSTLASGMLVYGLGRSLLLERSFVYVNPGHEGFLAIGQANFLGVPIPVWIFIGVAVAAHLFLSRTQRGRFLYAMGDNYEAARLSGIAVRPLTVMTYVLSSLVAILAGLVLAAEVASVNAQIFTSTMIFDVILVVVLGGVSLLGGRGSITSVVVGTLLIGVLLNGMVIMNFDNNVQNIVKSIVLLGAIIVDNRLHPRDEETARQGDI